MKTATEKLIAALAVVVMLVVVGSELYEAHDRIARGCIDVMHHDPFEPAPVKPVYVCSRD